MSKLSDIAIGSIGVCLELDNSPLFTVTQIIGEHIFIERIDKRQSFPYSIRIEDFWLIL
jgi:hypothetical protein